MLKSQFQLYFQTAPRPKKPSLTSSHHMPSPPVLPLTLGNIRPDFYPPPPPPQAEHRHVMKWNAGKADKPDEEDEEEDEEDSCSCSCKSGSCDQQYSDYSRGYSSLPRPRSASVDDKEEHPEEPHVSLPVERQYRTLEGRGHHIAYHHPHHHHPMELRRNKNEQMGKVVLPPPPAPPAPPAHAQQSSAASSRSGKSSTSRSSKSPSTEFGI